MLGFGLEQQWKYLQQLDLAGTFWIQTTNTSFLGGGQVGVNYEFGGGVVDWRGGHVRLAS